MRQLILIAAIIAVMPPVRADILAIPDVPPEESICFALYTVHEGVLKLTAQFYPLPEDAARTATLEIQRGDEWIDVATTQIIEEGWTAPFRVENWGAAQPAMYRVNHADTAYFEGTIQADPVDNEEIIVAAFTGNSI